MNEEKPIITIKKNDNKEVVIEEITDTELLGESEIKIQNKFKKFINFFFPPKNPKENIIQYFMRQMYIPDSSGNPSITVSILFYVMVLIAIVSYIEIKNAQVLVTKIANNIQTVGIPNGFSENFLYLLIGLSIVITSWYRIRQKDNNENDQLNNESAVLGSVKEYMKNVIGKLK